MVLTQNAKDSILTSTAALFLSGGVGLNSTTENSTDTGLFGGGTTLDACDATTGWSNSGDASATVLNTTAGYFMEGTGCLNLPTTFSAGVASWYKTLGSTNLASKKLYVWLYIDDASDLATSTNAVSLDLGTGGFTNYDTWNYANTSFSNGWNSLYVDVNTYDSTSGSGLVTSTTDRIRLNVNLTSTQTSTDMRMDYWRSYVAGTFGVTNGQKVLIKTTGTNFFKTTMNLTVTEGNGLEIVESGDNNGSILLSRQTFASITKGLNTQVQIDKYYYLE